MDTNLSLKEEQLLYLNRKFNFIKESFENNEVAEFVTTQVLLSCLKHGYRDLFIKKYQQIKPKFKGNYLSVSKNKCVALKEIERGKRAPDFEFEDVNGKHHFLRDFKNYVILIYVWSLGCHGSIEEWSNQKEIQMQFDQSGKILFLNIYNDNNSDALKRYLNLNELPGIHGFAGGWNSRFNKLYYINYTPRCILIQKGKIVDAFAPRPSSNKLLPMLRNTLNQ